MDAFNYQMLSVLKTKEERLGLMERMSMINDNVHSSSVEPEPEITIGGYTGVVSEWQMRTTNVQEARQNDPSWVSRFAKRIDDLAVVETDPRIIKQLKVRVGMNTVRILR